MKSLALILFTIFCSTQAAAALSCSQFAGPDESIFANISRLEPEAEFDQLLMAFKSIYEKTTFDFAVGKYEKYASLKDIELSDADVRFAMTLFLKHSYTHLPEDLLSLGRKALEAVPFDTLSEKEKIALALTYLHPKGVRQAERALQILNGIETAQASWHRAEVFYMLGLYSEALEQLNVIKDLEGGVSLNTQDAVDAVSLKVENEGSAEQKIQTYWAQVEVFKSRQMYKEAMEKLYQIDALIGHITPEVRDALKEVEGLLSSGELKDTGSIYNVF